MSDYGPYRIRRIMVIAMLVFVLCIAIIYASS